jgi:uncharacterized protein YodC (DUF2158 family)
MSETFVLGDTVWLKSGGPKMTVCEAETNGLTGDPMITCEWFVEAEHRMNSFQPTSLTKTATPS